MTADCQLAEESLHTLARRINARPRSANELPLGASMELTWRCNLRCPHCYLADASGPELDTAGVTGLLDLFAGHGVLFLLLTGGEPLLRPDFETLYRHAHRLGLVTTLFTNGTLVTPALADMLAAHAPRRIEVTLYGATPQTVARVTGLPDADAQVRHGLDCLRARRLPVHLKMLVTRDNVDEFPAVREWATRLGLPFRYDALLNPRLNGSLRPLEQRVPAETVRRLGGEPAPEILAEYDRRIGKARESEPATVLFGCGAGRKTVHVDPAGMAHPCLMWRQTPYDLVHGTVEGWNRHWAETRATLSVPADSACRTCDRRLVCPTCPALARLETGTAGMPVPYCCILAGRHA